MIKYGQIVKLTKSQELRVMNRYQSLIHELQDHFKYTTRKYPEKKDRQIASGYVPDYRTMRERGGFTDFHFTIPAGTLCILSQAIIDSKKEVFKVFIAHPKRKQNGRHLRNLGLTFSMILSRDGNW